jgi:hypothetical protein
MDLPPPRGEEITDVEDMNDALKGMANPSKVNMAPRRSPSYESESEESYESEAESEESADPVAHHHEPEQPGVSIMDEKADILYKLQRLKDQGFPSSRTFGMHSDIREMRSELARITTGVELERSLRFSRKAIVGLASMIEFANDKIDVIDLELDGWSDHMHQAVYVQKDFDQVFEELFFKYRGRAKMPPELRLVLMVGTSAVQFHMTKLMVKSYQLKAVNAVSPPSAPTPQTPAPEKRPEMRRPSATPPPKNDPTPTPFQGFVGFPTPPPPPVGPVPEMTRPFKKVQESPARSQSHSPHHSPQESAGDEDDRLSDIPSDLESVPSQLSSLVDEDEPLAPQPKKRKTTTSSRKEKKIVSI